jgi:hypothetical protein
MQIEVHVALHCEVLHAPFAAPGRPMVGGEHDVEVFGPQREGLGDVVPPGMGVSNHGSADGEDVMQSVGGVLGHTEGVVVGEVEVHFRRCLRAWSHLEHNAHRRRQSAPDRYG